MAAANLKDKNRMVFLAYAEKRQVENPQKPGSKMDDPECPNKVRFTVEGRDFFVEFGGTSENPVNFKLASRLLSKSRMWTNGAIISLEEVVSAGSKAKADAEAKIKAEAEAKAKADAAKK